METADLLLWAFKQNYHSDCANAAIHCAPVRYSPITFRLAEAIVLFRQETEREPVSPHVLPEVYAVAMDRGAYAEDSGR
jgi:hypothetical protein